jgi:hypothetical protein
MKIKLFLAACILVFLLDFFARRRYTMFLAITPIEKGEAEASFVCPNNIFNTFVLKLVSTNTTLSSDISGKVSVFNDGVLVEERTFSKIKGIWFSKADNEVAPKKYKIEKNTATNDILYRVWSEHTPKEKRYVSWDAAFKKGEQYTVKFESEGDIPDGTILGLTYFEFKFWWTPWR